MLLITNPDVALEALMNGQVGFNTYYHRCVGEPEIPLIYPLFIQWVITIILN
jgi:hypothetical protein